MADNSLESILGWMRNPENDVMLGWDSIAAIARAKTNTLLLQEYIARFNSGTYFKPITGEVDMVGGQWIEVIHDFIMDAPRLSFENADLDNSTAKLTCAILGGLQLTMKYHVDVWQVDKISEIDPLQGPKLFLDLNLARVEGVVEGDGRVYLDLQYSDNFRLTFGSTEYEQRLGGDFFKALFNALPPEQRIWVMGRIQEGGNELLTPESFKLRTQSRGVESRDRLSPLYGDGAVLIFIRMVGNDEVGDLNPEYRYLIPDDAGKDYSATVLLGRERMTSAYPIMDFAPGLVVQLMGRDDFDYVRDAAGRVIKATVRSGALDIPPSSVKLLPVHVGGGRYIEIEVYQNGASFSGASADPLQLSLEADGRVSISWSAQSRDDVIITFPNSEYPPHPMLSMTTVNVSGHYAYAEGGSNDFIIMPAVSVNVESDSVDTLPSQKQSGEWLIVIGYIIVQLAILSRSTIEPKIRAALDKTLALETSLNTFIQESIELNFGNAIVGDVIRAPKDVGFFGRVNPTHTRFQISPLQPLMAAGGSQQFSTEPVVEGLTWTKAALPDEPGDNIGDITLNGLYQAPAANDIEGRFVRVRITATESVSGYSSSALVTVFVNNLTVNPLIQPCAVDRSVELKAGALGGGELLWAIKNFVPGESGRIEPSDLPDGDHRYVAAPLPNEDVYNAYVLDEVEVTHTATGAKKSVWVLADRKETKLTLKPFMPTEPLPPGQLSLQAMFNGERRTVEWSLPTGGPGSISSDSEGYALYRADPQASERFVLIFAKWDTGVIGILEGHIILPLPLDEFPAELQLMKAAPGN